MANGSITESELRQGLQQQLQASGALNGLKARLRNQLLSQLQHHDPTVLQHPDCSKQYTDDPLISAVDSAVVEYLHWRRCEYSLSVFCPESNAIAQPSSAAAHAASSLLGSDAWHKYNSSSPVLLNLAHKAHNMSQTHDACVGADAESIAFDTGDKDAACSSLPDSVTRQLHAIDNEHNDRLRQMRDGQTPSNEQRIVAMQHDAQLRAQAEADERVRHVRNVELGRTRAEEAEKRRQMVNQAKQELQREHSERLEHVRRREEALAEKSRSQNREIERAAYERRKELAQESERLSERSKELEKTEKWLKDREEAVQRRETAVEERECALSDRRKALEESAEEEISIRKRSVGKSAEELEKQLQREQDQLTERNSELETARKEVKDARAEAHEALRAQKRAEGEIERLKASLQDAIDAREDALAKADESQVTVQRIQRQLNEERQMRSCNGLNAGSKTYSYERDRVRHISPAADADSKAPNCGLNSRGSFASKHTSYDPWCHRLREIQSHEKRFNEQLQSFRQRASRDRSTAQNALATAISEAEASRQPSYGFAKRESPVRNRDYADKYPTVGGYRGSQRHKDQSCSTTELSEVQTSRYQHDEDRFDGKPSTISESGQDTLQDAEHKVSQHGPCVARNNDENWDAQNKETESFEPIQEEAQTLSEEQEGNLLTNLHEKYTTMEGYSAVHGTEYVQQHQGTQQKPKSDDVMHTESLQPSQAPGSEKGFLNTTHESYSAEQRNLYPTKGECQENDNAKAEAVPRRFSHEKHDGLSTSQTEQIDDGQCTNSQQGFDVPVEESEVEYANELNELEQHETHEKEEKEAEAKNPGAPSESHFAGDAGGARAEEDDMQSPHERREQLRQQMEQLEEDAVELSGSEKGDVESEPEEADEDDGDGVSLPSELSDI